MSDYFKREEKVTKRKEPGVLARHSLNAFITVITLIILFFIVNFLMLMFSMAMETMEEMKEKTS